MEPRGLLLIAGHKNKGICTGSCIDVSQPCCYCPQTSAEAGEREDK
jgi:hypothetical protein